MESVFKKSGMNKLDSIIYKVIKGCSYASGVTLAVMAIWATVNVIYSKLTLNSIPSTMDWIAYLLVPTVFLAVGVEILENGLISVDLITERFPLAVRKFITACAYFIGAVLSVIMCWQQFGSMVTNFQIKRMSSATEKMAFPIWPFNLITTVGLAIMTFAMIWYVIRELGGRKPNGEIENVDEAVSEMEEIEEGYEK